MTVSTPPLTHLNPHDAAGYLLTTHKVLANWRSLGTGPRYVKIGSKVFYRLVDLESFVSERLVETADSVGR